MTRYAASALLLSFSMAAPAFAQPADRTHGYVFAAFGNETRSSAYFHPGIGGDWVFGNGFGIGGEVGAVIARRRGTPNLALLSGNGSYHIRIDNAAVDPFGTLGISMVTTGGSSDVMWNWGGGVNWWWRPRLGLRLEFRDHVWSRASRHLVEFRFGVSFR